MNKAHVSIQPCTIESGGQCKGCVQLDCLNKQITDATILLEDLLKKRDDWMMTQINTRHDPFTSILPREIASLVFEHYVADGGSVFFLSWVCRTWREIAWATPSLWTKINIKIRPWNRQADVQFLKAHIRHSGRLPLSISLVDRARRLEEAPTFPVDETLVDTVNQCSDRWEYLELELDPYLLQSFRGRSSSEVVAPMLEELVLSPDFCGPEDEDRVLFSVGQIKPRPSKIKFKNMPPQNIDIEWGVVTSVDASGIYLHEALDLLLRAPHATHCKLEIYTLFNSETAPPIPSAVQHNLQVLCLRSSCDRWAQILPIFTNLTLPNLEHLKIEGDKRAQDLPSTSLVSLLVRSSCPLATLDLNEVHLTADDLNMVLTAAPSLKKLSVSPCLPDGCPELDPLFGLLAKTADDASQRFLPLLESIAITGFIASWDPVVDFCLQASCPGGRPLTDVEVNGRVSVSVSELECPPPRSSTDLSTLHTTLEGRGISMAVRLREIAVHDSCEHSTDLVYIKVNA
ncbi:hypothetical protein CVT26_015073 [Gymnopilus dilepis]|uniref:F-box domain-containing protein n=1 Tax=Gymnopilus dilepis TaxID=231916 RepID=A0A409X784_9AGAR|nr:hypothetical protein CVT26_015073 [Gymnopilus dilepis]